MDPVFQAKYFSRGIQSVVSYQDTEPNADLSDFLKCASSPPPPANMKP